MYFGVLYKMITEMTNIRVLTTLVKLKYQNPIEKQVAIITPNISMSIIRDIFVFPLPYQQINANSGDNRESLYHIIIYLCGLKPLYSY